MELTWRRGIVLSLAVVAVSTLCQASDTPDYRCFDFLDGLGTIEPRGDIIIEVGSSYDALCLFDPQRIKAKDVYFLHSGKTAEAPYRIPHTVVNNSAISVQVTHDEAVNYKLQCHMNETFLCERSVKVGYMPQDVENFTCVSKNFQTLNCTWKIPENPVRVNYNLTYVVVGFLDTRDCPRTQKQKTECFWDRDHSLFRNEWVMTFTARNKLTKKAVKYNHTVDIYATVIPDPPGELVAEVNGPHDVNLTWKLPYPIDVFPGGVVQEVSYRERLEGYNSEAAPWHVVDQWEVMPKRFESELFSKEINNLRPYTRYDFRVRLHTGTGLIREHMWSDASICTERTVAARPTKAPVTGIGTFEIEETLSLREIYINWRKIDAIFWNGPNFHYRVLVFDNENGRPINKNSQEVEIRETFAKFTNMDKDIPYRFEIRPVNDVGPAAEDVKATVVVLEMASILKPLSFFRVTAINEDNSTIYMSRWHLPDVQQENQMIETLTIYWCKKDKYEQRCQNKLEWITIEDMNITSKNLTDLDDSSLYMFGISANSNNSSSGIKWLTCIASHGNRPPPLEKFGVTHKTNTEVKLNWALDCKAKAAVPTGFNISYCSVADSVDDCPPEAEIMYETLHDETLVEYVVEKLHPYTNYIFNIAILTEIGLGKWSSSVKAKTMPYKPSGPPQDLEVRTKGQEWVLLAWKPPLAEELNGKIFEYIVTSEPPVDRFNVRANSTSNVTMLNVTNLEPYTEYIFQVIPCTEGPRVAYCGDISASFEVRTKIGAPGEIDSIDQEDDQLEWEHEECNAPQCSFEIHYRMNGTDHAYFTSAGHLAVNFKDLNITCTESQEEINIDMRAISKDEDGQTLKGPWKDKKIICHIPGSYSYNHVPSISVQPQVILVQFPTSNQYNTIFNLMTVPYGSSQQSPTLNMGSMGLDPGWHSGLKRLNSQNNEYFTRNVASSWQTLVTGNRVNKQHWFENSNGHLPVMGSDTSGPPWAESESRIQNPWYRRRSLEGDNTEQLGSDPNVREWQVVNGKLNPSLLTSNVLWTHLLGYRDAHNSNDNLRPSNDGVQSSLLMGKLPQYSLESSVISTSGVSLESSELFALTTPVTAHQNIDSLQHKGHNEETKSISHDNNVSSYGVKTGETEEVEKNSSKLGCPLIELMRAKGVEVQLNASSDKFELNIKGHGGAFDLVQSIFRHSLVLDGLSNRNENEPSMTSSLPEIDAGNVLPIDTKLSVDNDNDLLDEHTPSELEQNNDTELKRDEILVNVTVNPSVNTTRDMIPAHSVEDTTLDLRLHEQSSVLYTSQLSVMTNESGVTTVSVSDEARQLMDNSSQVHSTFSSDTMQTENTVDHVLLIHDGARKNSQLDEQVEGTQPYDLSSEGTRFRRSPGTPSVVVIQAPSSRQLSVLDLLQGRVTPGNSNNQEMIMTDDREQAELVNDSTRKSLYVIRNGNAMKNREASEEPQIEYQSEQIKDLQEQHILESSQPRASMIYNLGLLGSFNGNVGHIVPQVISEHAVPLNNAFPEDIDDSAIPSSSILELSSLPAITRGKEPTREDLDENNNLVSDGPNRGTLNRNNINLKCPFNDMIESQDVKIHVNTLEDGKFEIIIQGNDSLYDLMEKFINK